MENPLLRYPAQWTYFRKLLTPQEQQIYDRIEAALARLEFKVRLPEVRTETLGRVLSALRYDHPERVFYVDLNAVRGVTERTRLGLLTTSASTTLELPSRYPGVDFFQKLAETTAYTDYILRRQQETGAYTDYEIAKLVHDELARSIRYRDHGPESHTMLGAIEGQAVCEGIACLYKYLTSILGVHSFVVVGELRGSGQMRGDDNNHAYNIVRIGKENLFVDVTNDLSFGAAVPRQDHFAKTRAELWATHRPIDLRTIPEGVVGREVAAW